MNIAEVYQALEQLENGKDLIDAIKGETSRLNNEAKTTREKLQGQITTLTGERDTLSTRVSELEGQAGAGSNSPEYKQLEKQLKAMSDKFEQAETKAKEAEAKRIQSEIMAQTLDAFTKANAVDPQEFARLVANDIKVQDDGTYGYQKKMALSVLFKTAPQNGCKVNLGPLKQLAIQVADKVVQVAMVLMQLRLNSLRL